MSSSANTARAVGSELLGDALVNAIAEAVYVRILQSGTKASNPAQPRLLTVDAAGSYLSRSADAIRALIKTGKIPVVRLDARVFVDVRDLDRLIDTCKV
jgi:hypothetical protein